MRYTSVISTLQETEVGGSWVQEHPRQETTQKTTTDTAQYEDLGSVLSPAKTNKVAIAVKRKIVEVLLRIEGDTGREGC